VLVLGGAARVQASNAVLNPGFESDCAGVPCEWSAAGGSTVSRDTANPSGGAASLRIDDAASSGAAVTDCLTSFGNGSYAASFFYRTTSTNLALVKLTVNFYSGGNCTGGLGGTGVTDGPTNDGVWHQRSGTLVAPAGTNSVEVLTQFTCSGACGASKTVNYDDLSLVRSNAVLNPDFESDCAGVPCDWGPFGPELVSRDLSDSHGGAASMQLTGSTSPVQAVSGCLSSFGNGSYAASFF